MLWEKRETSKIETQITTLTNKNNIMKVQSIIIRVNTKAREKQLNQLLSDGFTVVAEAFKCSVSGTRVVKLIKPLI